jgi:predicted DNA binding CopG/RHH family protein
MKKKIKYTKAPKDVEDALGKGLRIPDFLPSPHELAESEKKVKVTILLGLESINFFKQEAKKTGYPYQRMINKVIEQYTKHYLKK